MHCFNSITVQLRPGSTPSFLSVYKMFQFHNGTIKTSVPNISIVELLVFQFHNGTIKTLSSTLATCMKARFNSITVQLRPKRKF